MPSTSKSKTNRLRGLIAGLSIALLGLGLAPTAKANDKNERTVFTLATPIEIPGKILTAGTYVFRLMDSDSNRTVLKIYDRDEQHLDATVVAVTDYREEVTGNPVLQFAERPFSAPSALKAFFYPGEQYGLEFVYPHRQAVAIAGETHQAILSMPDNDGKGDLSLKSGPITRVSPSSEAAEMIAPNDGQ